MKTLILSSILLISLFAISTNGIEYNKADSLDYLFYQKASYCPRSNITHWECGNICKFHPNMKDIKVYFNETHAAQGYVGYNKDTIIVAFRGSTRTLTNWLYNFDVTKTTFDKCDKCSIHTGFHKTYTDIKEQLFTKLESVIHKYPKAPIVITGHSLGGAVATVAAIDIQHFLNEQGHHNIIKEVHTFGSPRVGNPAFADYYNKLIPQTVRVVHNKDIVPHAPPSFLGFSHVGTEVWLDAESDTYKICTPFIEDKSCSTSVASPSITDHVTYLNNNTGCRYPNNKNVCLNEVDQEDCTDQDIEEAVKQAEQNKAKLMLLTNKRFES